MSRKDTHKISFIVKIKHNELLTYPAKFDQIMFGSVEDAWNLGAVAGITVSVKRSGMARERNLEKL